MAKFDLKKNVGDLTDPKSKFAILDKGKYLCQVANVEDKTSKDGNPGIKVYFNVMEPTKDAGVEIADYISLKFDEEKQDYPSGWKLKMLLNALFGEKERRDISAIDTDEWLDKHVVVFNSPETNEQGFENNVVKAYSSVWSGKSTIGDTGVPEKATETPSGGTPDDGAEVSL